MSWIRRIMSYILDLIAEISFIKNSSDKKLVLLSVIFAAIGCALIYQSKYDYCLIISLILLILAVLLFVIFIRRKQHIKLLLHKLSSLQNELKNTVTVAAFMQYYEQMSGVLTELQEYEKVTKLKFSPTNAYNDLVRDFQIYIQSALMRDLYYRLDDTENIEKQYKAFCKETDLYRHKFSYDTREVVRECKFRLKEQIPSKEPERIETRNNNLLADNNQPISNFNTNVINQLNSESGLLNGVLSLTELVDNEMVNIDLMHTNGWLFEQYCAELLLYNGFTQTEVTQSSNDYGVDIIAINPDGIKYAIQCKCYSNRLGNTPVQEIAAGMNVYNCHVGVVLTNNVFTDNAITLAENNGILLWDRDKLKNMVEVKQKQILEGKTIQIPTQEQNDYKEDDSDDFEDPLLPDAIKLAIELGKISPSMVQRRLNTGYSRSLKIIDQMEYNGYIKRTRKNAPYDVLISHTDTYI